MKTLLLAAWIAPIECPPLRDGGIVFDRDRIIALGPAEALRRRHPDALAIDADDALILPGLVNPHTHLELTDHACGDAPPGGFVQWIERLRARSQSQADRMPESVTQAVIGGIAQCLRFGVTSVGDITRHCSLTRPLLASGPLRAVSYGEVIALGALRARADDALRAAADPAFASDRLTIGITPHAPYTVEPDVYRLCLAAARRQGHPLATHLAETPFETEFLARHSGPFRELWESLQLWGDRIPRFEGGPIRLAESLGLLDYPTLLAHVNYCDDQELDILARSRASIVYCPRTHAWFSHPPHRWCEMLQRGINVAVGTDSCASSPDLNILEDLRLLHRLFPDVPPHVLWEMATIRAARALQAEQRIGSLSPGKAPDFILFPIATDDPLREILEQPILPTQLWIAGRRL